MPGINRENEKKLTYNTANGMFKYEPSTGLVIRIKSMSSGAIKGKEAGSKHTSGYRRVKYDGAEYLVHRLAWLLVHGRWPDKEIDHEDGNKCNNRMDNLRIVPRLVNSQNTCLSSRNTSGVMGVHWEHDRRMWRSVITVVNRQIRLGRYSDFFDAVCARKSANVKYGFHKNHGRQKD